MDSGESVEIGATVADVRRLARQADRVSVFYWVGPFDRRDCLGFKPSVFLKMIAHKPDDDRMPCRLHRYPDRLSLMIGVEP
jgi:hypothetical protein